MINDQVKNQVFYQVNGLTLGQVSVQVYDQVNLQVRDHLWKQFAFEEKL